MGKSGALLRQQKAQRTVYTFTREQLEEHDRMVKEAYRESCKMKLEKMFNEKRDEVRDKECAMMMNCCLMVLVKDLGFKPYRDSRSRIGRFMTRAIEEVTKVTGGDISEYRYMLKTKDECGLYIAPNEGFEEDE